MYNLKLTYSEESKIFVTSDSHYSHINICRGISTWEGKRNTRDFNTIEEMNNAIVNGINSVVSQNDILIHLGDWSFNGIDKAFEFRKRLLAKQVYWVRGNHDEHIFKNKENVQSIFDGVYTELDLDIVFKFEHKKGENQTRSIKQRFFCYHHPVASWREMKKGVIHLHGHNHLSNEKKIGSNGKYIDAGADGNNYKPYDIKWLYNFMNNRQINKLTLPEDHHELWENIQFFVK